MGCADHAVPSEGAGAGTDMSGGSGAASGLATGFFYAWDDAEQVRELNHMKNNTIHMKTTTHHMKPTINRMKTI